MSANPADTARFLGAFFDELVRWGVRDVVVSPGSRSTPLAMCAYELSQRMPEKLRLFVDVDERGAAFLALGLAKGSGHPAAVICTSGTAVANYYPAVMEAESSRVPLVVLTGDRPPQLQGLGAPQTCDQIKAFGDHVRAFRQMPLPTGDAEAVAFARQAAREAVIAACPLGLKESETPLIAGSCMGGPVHLNFPFDEPLKPDLSIDNLFEQGRANFEAPGICSPQATLSQYDYNTLRALIDDRHTLVVAGEGTAANQAEAYAVLDWILMNDLPVLADPLSGLRGIESDIIIDNYDTILGDEQLAATLMPQVIVRFGRWPVSKRATVALKAANPIQIVVDPLQTRDFTSQTDVFVPFVPADFARAMRDPMDTYPGDIQQHFMERWLYANRDARKKIEAIDQAEQPFEGSFVRRAIQLAPKGSCVFAANSMSIRAIDTFYLRDEKPLTIMCNRGLNGIDGTVSTAIGVAQSFEQTILITGDLTLLHDLNALALQRELLTHHANGKVSSLVIVLLNNNGGCIFDMLPQKSSDGYFERLFLTPQDVDFQTAAAAFKVAHQTANTLQEFDAAYQACLGTPGISLIEVPVPLEGLKDRYAPYWS